jgi:translation initiation factor 2A
VLNPDHVLIFNAQTGVLAHTIPRPNVLAVAFSPLNSFLVTWERLEEKVNNNENNLIVWRLETTEPIVKFTQKVFATDLW